jgi:undecaprenyl-diphosphatase
MISAGFATVAATGAGLLSSPATVAVSRTPTQGAGNSNNIEDVPDISADWYRDVVDFAATTPAWLQSFAAFFTDAAIMLLLGFMLVCWWRARKQPARPMAFALIAPVGMVVAYGLSETTKAIMQVERPCRTLANVVTISECPPPGDWSFPSNHSVIAGATVVGIVFAWRTLGYLAGLVGLCAAASRVFVGAHYPHDAAAGFVLGAAVAAVMALVLVHAVTKLVSRLREHSKLSRLLADKDGAERGAGNRRLDLPGREPSQWPLAHPGTESQPTQPLRALDTVVLDHRTASGANGWHSGGRRPAGR